MEHPTIIALNLDNSLDINDFVKYCSKFLDCQILIASKTKHNVPNNVIEVVFDKASADVAINSLVPYATGNKLVIVRKIEKDNYKNLDLFINSLKNDNQICTFSKDTNKIQQFIHDLSNKVIKFIFGYKLYNGGISIISFGKNVIELLKSVNNSSMYTKVNPWIAVDIVELPMQDNHKIRFKTNNKNQYIRLSVEFLFLITPLLCWIFIDYVKTSFLLKALFVLFMALSIFIISAEIILMCVKRFVGQNECDKIDCNKIIKGELYDKN